MRPRIVFVPGLLPFLGLEAHPFPAGVGVGVGLSFGVRDGFVGGLAGAFGVGFGVGFFSASFLTVGFLVGSLDRRFSCVARSIDRNLGIGKTATAHVLASKAVIVDVIEVRLAIIGTESLASPHDGKHSRLKTTLDSFIRLIGAAELVDRLSKPGFLCDCRDTRLLVQRLRLADNVCECQIEGHCQRDHETGSSRNDKGAEGIKVF